MVSCLGLGEVSRFFFRVQLARLASLSLRNALFPKAMNLSAFDVLSRACGLLMEDAGGDGGLWG